MKNLSPLPASSLPVSQSRAAAASQRTCEAKQPRDSSGQDLAALAQRWSSSFEKAAPIEILRWAADRFEGRCAVVTSFQAEGMVILDQLHRSDLAVRILTIDTGRLPDETHLQIERVRSHYGFEVEVVMPDAPELAQIVSDQGPNFFRQSSELRLRCCFLRKVLPLRAAVKDLDCWITGIRTGQGGLRSRARAVELDLTNDDAGTLFKVSPLVDWSEQQVWDYIHEQGVPYHPLYDQGYRSIGCAPCTRRSRPGESAREARWWWEGGGRECGLHGYFDVEATDQPSETGPATLELSQEENQS